jgi:hypothetical protein
MGTRFNLWPNAGRRVEWTTHYPEGVARGTVVAWIALPPDRDMEDRKGYSIGTGYARVVAVVAKDAGGYEQFELGDLR